ncbi:MAG: T6SS effector amidase Tae4 family protein [Polyangiaceae bacterium]
MSVTRSIGVASLVLFWAASASALTPPTKGATAFPANVELSLPFPAGAKARVLAGYGPYAGSELHVYADSTYKANEYHALDLVIDGKPNGGKGTTVVAPLAGKVLKSGWATSNWRNYGERIVLEHDLGDGHRYYSVYAHLDSIAVSEGMTVRVGQPIGTLGSSCNMAASCPSFDSPHLHWSIHRDALIGGTGTGGSYAGHAVVPEPLDGEEDLVVGSLITSTTTEEHACGDGVCSGSETGGNCAGDCKACEPVPAAGRVIDDGDACFERLGPAMNWHLSSGGLEGDLSWTYVRGATKPESQARWNLELASAGSYDIEVYTKHVGGYTLSKKAKYSVTHAGQTSTITLDQGAKDGWQKLGTFAFAKGGKQSVRLDDNTWESLLPTRQLLADGLRVTPANGEGKGDAPGHADSASESDASTDAACAVSRPGSRGLGLGGLSLAVVAGLLGARRRRSAAQRLELSRRSVTGFSLLSLALALPACTNGTGDDSGDDIAEEEPLDPMDMSFEMDPLGKGDAVRKLPPLKALWDAYPMGPAADVKKKIGGAVDAAWITNTCTVRLSRSLNYGGFDVPNPSKAKPMNVIQGGDKKWYAFRVREMSEYLRTRVGKPDVVSTDRDDFLGKKGIIKFTISGSTAYTGHFDLWDGTGPRNHEYFGEQAELWITPETSADAGAEGGADAGADGH